MRKSDKRIADLKEAGEQYVGDWLCWNEKQLAKLPEPKDKRNYIQCEAHLPDCAFDMAACDPDTGEELSQQQREGDADWIYEGMCQAVKEFLKDPETWYKR